MSLQIIRQDITKVECDVIVNATNEDLIPGGQGVDSLIHTVAGPGLFDECSRIGHIETGKAAMTGAYGLPCKKVIHTAGPVWHGGNFNERALLESCYHSSLSLAKSQGFESIAFPLISSGEYGFPKDKVMKVAVDSICEFLMHNEMTVYLVVYDKDSFSISKKLFSDVSEFIDDSYVPVSRMFCSERSERILPTASYFRERPGRQKNKRDSDMGIPVFEDESCSEPSVEDYLKNVDESFALTIMKLIDMKGMTNSQCYTKANVSKQTWYKIMNEESYHPSKNTIISFAIALELTFEETQALLSTAGYTLSGSIKFDQIIKYFLVTRQYDIYIIEQTLFQFDQPLLCSY